ncbi:MAG: hypothetical protein ACWGQW_21180 [bacterium]
MDKVAVDKATKQYWDTYFKEYGKMWTRDIPRRVKTAMVRTKDLGVKTAEGNVAPIAHHVADDGTLFIEAAFSGKLDDLDAKVLITASFNDEGNMLTFEANRVA